MLNSWMQWARRGWIPRDISGCVLWLRGDQGITLASTLRASGTTPPAVTISGQPTGTIGLRVEIQTTGARGTATFRYSANNGTTWIESSKTTAATYTAIGAAAGITFTFPVGTYTNDDVYEGVVSQWNDFSGHGNNATQATASRQPRILANGVNGYPAPQGIVASSSLTLPTVVIGSGTLCIVAPPAIAANSYYSSGTGDSSGFLSNWSGVAYMWYDGAAKTFSNSATGAHILTVTNASGGTLTGYLDGTQAFTNGSAPAVNSQTAILNSSPSFGSCPLVAQPEFIYYNRVLSALELGLLHNYLGKRYGITV